MDLAHGCTSCPVRNTELSWERCWNRRSEIQKHTLPARCHVHLPWGHVCEGQERESMNKVKYLWQKWLYLKKKNRGHRLPQNDQVVQLIWLKQLKLIIFLTWLFWGYQFPDFKRQLSKCTMRVTHPPGRGRRYCGCLVEKTAKNEWTQVWELADEKVGNWTPFKWRHIGFFFSPAHTYEGVCPLWLCYISVCETKWEFERV